MTTTIPPLDPRSTSVECLYDAHWARRLKVAGYGSVGAVIDAGPEALASRIFSVGPKRAAQLRQRALDYVIGFETARQHAEFHQIDSAEIDGPTPEFWDAVKTIGSLIAICGLFALSVWCLS